MVLVIVPKWDQRKIKKKGRLEWGKTQWECSGKLIEIKSEHFYGILEGDAAPRDKWGNRMKSG